MRPLDLEARLRRLEGPPPSEALRGRVLAAIDAALAQSRVPALDRWLARPAPWIAAAAVLLATWGAGLLAEPPARGAGGASAVAPPGVTPEIFARREQALLALLGATAEGGR